MAHGMTDEYIGPPMLDIHTIKAHQAYDDPLAPVMAASGYKAKSVGPRGLTRPSIEAGVDPENTKNRATIARKRRCTEIDN